MAEELIKLYNYVGNEKGIQGKIELAKLTKVPSMRAATMPDSPEVVKQFKEAIKQITGLWPTI